MVLENEPELVVCGMAATAEEALATAAASEPDFMLIDVSLPDMSGIELARTLHDRHPDLPLAMLSGHREQSHVEQALAAGARGYVLKGSGEELAPAIRRMMRGERYLSEALRGG